MAKKDTATLENPAPAPAVTGSAQGQPTASTASALEPAAQKNDVKAGGPPSGFYIYLGPTIRGLIQANTIYRGDRAHALAEAKEAIEKYPLIKTLIVPGDYLPVARLRIKTPGNALHANYTRLVEQVKDGRRKEASANG